MLPKREKLPILPAKEEYAVTLDEYEKLLSLDHIEITSLKATAGDPENNAVNQFEHFDLLYGALSYSALCGFCQYLTNLQPQLSALSERILSVLQRLREANIPAPLQLTELANLIRDTRETKSQSLLQMNALLEAYKPLLSEAMYKLNIPGSKSKSIEVQERSFNETIKKMLLKTNPAHALIDWFDRSCRNTRYLLNFLMTDVGNHINNQRMPIATKHQHICQVLTVKWQQSSEYESAITSGCN